MATLSLVASVLQVADIGVRLSCKLVSVGIAVGDSEESIAFLSKDISHTSSILRGMGTSLECDHKTACCSESMYKTTDAIVRDCREVFEEMNEALVTEMAKLGFDRTSISPASAAIERMRWPFLLRKIENLGINLNKLKSTLLLMLNVMIYTRLVEVRAESPAAVGHQWILITDLLRANTDQINQYESLKETVERNSARVIEVVKDLIYESPILRKLPTTPTDMCVTCEVGEPWPTRNMKPATESIEQYCELIQSLLGRIRTAADRIGDDMRVRMRDAIVESHRRETRLLSVSHGFTRVKEIMRGDIWELAGMPERSKMAKTKGAQVIVQDGHSRGTGSKTSRSWDLPLIQAVAMTGSSNVTFTAPHKHINSTLDAKSKEIYGAAEPISFDDSVLSPFRESIDCMFSSKDLNVMTEDRPRQSHDRSRECCSHVKSPLRVGTPSSVAQPLKTIMTNRRFQHNYAIDSFLDGTGDPFTGLGPDRMSPALDGWIPQGPGLIPIGRAQISIMPNPTLSNAPQDLVALTSDTGSFTTESEATSEGENCLDSCHWALERESLIVRSKPSSASIKVMGSSEPLDNQDAITSCKSSIEPSEEPEC